MKIKEFRALLEERVEDLEKDIRDLLTGDDDGEFLITLGKIGAYRMILENYIEESSGYVPKHGRE